MRDFLPRLVTNVGSRCPCLLATLATLLVLYGNIAVILNEAPFSTGLPQLTGQMALFDIFAVFSFYETENTAIVLRGTSAGGQKGCPGAGQAVVLPVDTLLPFFRGEQQMRAWLARHYNAGGRSAQQQAYRPWVQKMAHWYGRAHPGCRISDIQVIAERWPRSLHGYTALKTPGKTRTEHWYPDLPEAEVR